MPLGGPEIAALIPHAGAMCLLDAVRFWDETTIVCTASSHHHPDNPLASHGTLDAVCGIEYAAQAMAVHGALTATAGRRPAAGYLASVREVTCHSASPRSAGGRPRDNCNKAGWRRRATALHSLSLLRRRVDILTYRAAVVLDA